MSGGRRTRAFPSTNFSLAAAAAASSGRRAFPAIGKSNPSHAAAARCDPGKSRSSSLTMVLAPIVISLTQTTMSERKLAPFPIRAPKFSATVWPMSESVARTPRFTPRRARGP